MRPIGHCSSRRCTISSALPPYAAMTSAACTIGVFIIPGRIEFARMPDRAYWISWSATAIRNDRRRCWRMTLARNRKFADLYGAFPVKGLLPVAGQLIRWLLFAVCC